ncbi:hypothetical protein GIB67_027713 [Kingdonia uniflora]|uniref:Uncharacterized protein n=1 Tax=Kingdonia uniflora TaxID=39325 RepID=A0A7J7NL62_9MAGN|nr:hypothetical protein GIB67_027713 [Kingdonia uniflora]
MEWLTLRKWLSMLSSIRCGWKEITELWEIGTVWTELIKLLGYNRTVGNWDSEIEWSAQNFQDKDGMVNLKKMAFNAFFYQVWMERNNRIFKKIETPHKVILFKLVDEIRVKAAYKDMELKDTPQAQVLANWNLNGLLFLKQPIRCQLRAALAPYVTLNTDGSFMNNKEG